MRAAKRILRGSLALCALAALPASAPASQVEVDSSNRTLRYDAAPGETNRVSILVAVNFQNEAFIDDSVRVTPGPNCRRAGDTTQAVCEIGAEVLSLVEIELGDRHDRLIYRVSQSATNPLQDSVVDGPGNDVVQLDSWEPVAGNGPGNDVFRCLSRCRVLTGVTAPFQASGGGNDRMFGSGQVDRLMGGSGRDVIFGGAGADRLYGGSGDDRLYGQAGNDWLFGGPGMDVLFGGPGTDRLFQ